MDSISLLVNKKLISIEDRQEIIEAMANDDEFLIDYVCRAISMGRIPFCTVEDLKTVSIERLPRIPASSQNDPSHCVETLQEVQQSSSEEVIPGRSCSDPPKKVDVWVSKGKPTQEDKEATFHLLQLRGSEKFSKKFDDKSSVKLELWKQIATLLQSQGYNVTAISCRQKFANLYKYYIKYKQHLKTTGAERKEAPEFFDQMDAILGQKDKVNLLHVVDSMENNTAIIQQHKDNAQDDYNMLDNNSDGDNENIVPVRNTNETNEEKTTPKKHKITKADIIQTIETAMEKQRVQNKTEFDTLMEAIKAQNSILAEQNVQRGKFLEIMTNFLNPQPEKKNPQPKKKRTRSDESDSD